MKAPKSTIEVIEDNTLESFSLGISQENIGHITSILRNSLYSNKIQAVIREVLCNARDVSVLVKTDKPIDIVLPAVYQGSNFSVRDYGTGLSKELIESLYSQYGKSTKTNSNLQVGFFGIGKFSPLSYVNNFTIISYYEGIKYIYTCYIDDRNIGKITLLSEEPSSEPSGLEISLVIEKQDYNVFQKELYSFLTYFDYPVSIGGKITPAQNVFKDKDFIFTPFITTASRWGEPEAIKEKLAVIMGGVCYPINSNSLKLSEKDSPIKSLLKHHIVIKAKIGQVNISASRESLEYTPTTIDFIVKKLYDIREDLINELLDKHKLISNYKEAFEFYIQNRHLAQIIDLDIINSWNGKKFVDYLDLKFTDSNGALQAVGVLHLTYGRYGSYKMVNSNSTIGWSSIDNNKTPIIYYNDMEKKKDAEYNIRENFYGKNHIYLIDLPTLKQVEDLFNMKGYTGFTFLPASSVPKREKPVYSRTKSAYLPINSAYRIHDKNISCLDNEQIDWTGNHYYVFKSEYSSKNRASTFNYLFHDRISEIENLYGIKVYLFDSKQLQKAAKYPNIKPFSNLISEKSKLMELDNYKKILYYLDYIKTDHNANAIYDFFNKAVQFSDKEKQELSIFGFLINKSSFDVSSDEIIKDFYTKYPLLEDKAFLSLDNTHVKEYIAYRDKKSQTN